MSTLNPYVHFNGNAEEAFNFYKSVFGGEFTTISRNKDIPAGTQNPTACQSGMNGLSQDGCTLSFSGTIGVVPKYMDMTAGIFVFQ